MTRKRSKRQQEMPLMADLFDLPTSPPEVSRLFDPVARGPTTDEPKKGARKPFKTLYSRKAKQDWTYSRQEVMDLYDVCRNTVTNWIKEGLVYIPDRPILFRGSDLNAFHAARRKRARKVCRPGEFFCFHCKAIVSLVCQSAGFRWDREHAGSLSWSCPSCGKPNEIYQSRSQAHLLTELGVNLTPMNDDYYPPRRAGEVVQIPPESEAIHEPVE